MHQELGGYRVVDSPSVRKFISLLMAAKSKTTGSSGGSGSSGGGKFYSLFLFVIMWCDLC